ncbi:MAG: hypothetical protein ACKVJG_16115 [Candidatus Latescibacterota bacterium]
MSARPASQLAERQQRPSSVGAGEGASQQQDVLPMVQEVPQQAVVAG